MGTLTDGKRPFAGARPLHVWLQGPKPELRLRQCREGSSLLSKLGWVHRDSRHSTATAPSWHILNCVTPAQTKEDQLSLAGRAFRSYTLSQRDFYQLKQKKTSSSIAHVLALYFMEKDAFADHISCTYGQRAGCSNSSVSILVAHRYAVNTFRPFWFPYWTGMDLHFRSAHLYKKPRGTELVCVSPLQGSCSALCM